MHPQAATAVVLLCFLTPLHAASLLRVSCEGPDVGAQITVNGAFKGDCPLDIQVPEGAVDLRVTKSVDATRERVFEQQFRIGDGVVKKVEATLSAPQPTPAARRRLEQEFQRFKQAAEAGDPEAMFRLAYRYEQGLGTAASEADAHAWYLRGAEAGNADAMTNLAYRYQTGRGVARDYVQAADWYRKAVELGNTTAMNNLAALYLGGSGVAKDPEAAVRLFEAAAAGGYADAAANLGVNYALGKVLPRNDALALEWYRKAAELGSPRGMYALGTFYANGRVVARDPEEALRWFRAAAAQNFSQAIEELKKRGVR